MPVFNSMPENSEVSSSEHPAGIWSHALLLGSVEKAVLAFHSLQKANESDHMDHSRVYL